MILKTKLWTILVLCICSLIVGNCTRFGSDSDHQENEDMNNLLALIALNNHHLSLNGNWTDTTDSNAQYTISNTSYVRLGYLGSTFPKPPYEMTIERFQNVDGILILRGLQLNFGSFPTIETQTNTIYQRTKFSLFDNNTFFYCAEASNKASLAELNADTASYTFTGESNTTCNGFVWSKMTRN